MNVTFNQKSIARNIALALAVGVLTVGCAGNAAKPTPSSTIESSPTDSSQLSEMSKDQVVGTVKTEEVEVNSEKQIEVSETKNNSIVETNPAAPVIDYPEIDISENIQPEKLNFQFGFDKAELSDEDTRIIKMHAKFLVDNPETVLNINGHTDHHGPKVYNEYLSKKRADAVAKILIEEGVQESQLQISALANSEPLLDVENTRNNRRVELKYIEMNMVSSE